MLQEQPIKIGKVRLGGRIAFPPMATEASDDGGVTRGLVDHYRKVAANSNVALIITEHAYVHPTGKASPGQLSVARDGDVDGLRELAGAVHAARPQARLFAQISHAGLNSRPEFTGGMLLGPSGDGVTSEALDASQIRAVEGFFARAAQRVKDAGFDGVELHAAHGYLLNEFLSPLVNDRDDQYGARSIEDRARMLVETIAATREAVGPDFPIAVRLGACDYRPGGTTIEDGAAIARLAEQAGADLVDVSGGMCGMQRPGHREPGYFADASRAVKAAVSVPVMTTGGVKTAKQAEQLLDKGAGDIVGVGRAIYRDPSWGMRA